MSDGKIKKAKQKNANISEFGLDSEYKKIIFQTNFSDELLKNSELLREKIEENYYNFSKRTCQIYNYRIVSLLMEHLVFKIQSLDHDFSEDMKQDINSFKEQKKELEEDNKIKLQNVIIEKAFIDHYQSFEDFLSLCFFSIYSLFPKFLINKQNSYLKIEFDNIFDNEKIDICRDAVIEREIIDIMHDPINKVVEKFNRFGIKIDAKEKFEELHYISLKRNIFEHSKGIINNEFVNKVKKMEKNDLYKKNDRLIISEKTLKRDVKTIGESVKIIREGIINQIPTLINYYSK